MRDRPWGYSLGMMRVDSWGDSLGMMRGYLLDHYLVLSLDLCSGYSSDPMTEYNSERNWVHLMGN
jgi:hypothetical protein